MVISTRVSIQWPPAEPEELTSTLAFTTPNDNYVDIRIFKSFYPYISKINKDDKFQEVFQWCIAGKEIPLDNGRIKFDNVISSVALHESLILGDPLVIDSDIGTFSEYGLDRKETGEMKNDNGVVSPYIEIWRSLDPLKHTPNKEVREDEENNDANIPIFALELINGLGRLVRIGNWIQGVIQDKDTVHVIRCWYDVDEQKWVNVIEFGEFDKFPIEFDGKVDDIITVDKERDWKWKCVEKS